jgi:Sec-independent protein secretion pathway component TatC
MTPQFLWKNARYAILVIAIVAAIVTPTPDAKTMLIFIVLMVALYFLGILLAAVFKGGSGPRGGPQHPLPVTSPLETGSSRTVQAHRDP